MKKRFSHHIIGFEETFFPTHQNSGVRDTGIKTDGNPYSSFISEKQNLNLDQDSILTTTLHNYPNPVTGSTGQPQSSSRKGQSLSLVTSGRSRVLSARGQAPKEYGERG